jgi:hypothetical protein
LDTLSFEPATNEKGSQLNFGDLRMYVSKSTQQQRKLREKINAKLGGKCSRCSCDDPRVLEIDHVNGGGSKELRRGWGGGMSYYYRVLKDTQNTYQLLCANCNKIKRVEEREALGRRQHKPAL